LPIDRPRALLCRAGVSLPFRSSDAVHVRGQLHGLSIGETFEPLRVRCTPMRSAGSRSAVSAVVVGADAHGLGIARSLAKGNVPVIIVDDDSLRPGMHSRYARPFVASTISGPDLVSSLLALQGSLNERPVLFVTSDVHVRIISEHRER